MFEGLLINIAILIAALLILSRSSYYTITNSINLANATGLGKTTIGFLLVAFSTSMPELLVSIFAAFGAGTSGVAIGNILGSNIVNVCLILGTCILLSYKASRAELSLSMGLVQEEVKSLYFGLFTASIIPLLLMYLKEGSRVIGAILFILFIYNSIKLSREHTDINEDVSEKLSHKKYHYLTFALVGVAGVVVSSYFLIDSALYIATSLGVPSLIIGSTIIAFGTSVPELATSIEATRQGHIELAFGNIVGSSFINLTCILGFTLLTAPFKLNMASFSDLAIFSLIANLMLWYFISSERLSWREGAILVTLYGIFLLITFGAITISV